MIRGQTITRWLDKLAASQKRKQPWIHALEVGRIRSVTETKGHSTVYIARHPAVERVTTLDIRACTRAPTLAVVPAVFHHKLEFVDADAVQWLAGELPANGHTFDFMYLDGRNDAVHCLSVLELCIGLSKPWTIMLLDDTDKRYAQKGILAVPYVKTHGEIFDVLEEVPADRHGATCQGILVARCHGLSDSGDRVRT